MMTSGINYKQGEIVLIPFPFSDLSIVKQRPVLIISKDAYNNETEDVIICGITSNLKNASYSILIDNEDLTEGSLPVKSRIKADKIFTLEKSLIKKKIAKVNLKIIEKVKSEILNLV